MGTLAFGKTPNCPSVFNCVCSEQRTRGKCRVVCFITLTIPKVSRARRSQPRWIVCPSPRIAKFEGQGKVLFPSLPSAPRSLPAWSQPGLFPRRAPGSDCVHWGLSFQRQRGCQPPHSVTAAAFCLQLPGSDLKSAQCLTIQGFQLSPRQRLQSGYLATNGHRFNGIGSFGLRVMARCIQTTRSMAAPVTGGRALMHNPPPKSVCQRTHIMSMH